MPENKLPKSSEDLMKFLTDLIEGNAEIPLTEDSLEENEVLIDGSSKGDGIFVLDENELSRININKNEWDLLKPYYDSKSLKRH